MPGEKWKMTYIGLEILGQANWNDGYCRRARNIVKVYWRLLTVFVMHSGAHFSSLFQHLSALRECTMIYCRRNNGVWHWKVSMNCSSCKLRLYVTMKWGYYSIYGIFYSALLSSAATGYIQDFAGILCLAWFCKFYVKSREMNRRDVTGDE